MDIPGYKLQRPLGQGGTAVVYLATQEPLQREVALKILNPLYSDDEQFSQRFLQEGRIRASLAHRDIITIHDIGIADDQFHYISVEYVPVKQGFTQIGDRYYALAGQSLGRREHDTATDYITRGLRVAPSHIDLLTLRRSLASNQTQASSSNENPAVSIKTKKVSD